MPILLISLWLVSLTIAAIILSVLSLVLDGLIPDEERYQGKRMDRR